jgi:hypothetical protein
MKITKNLRFSVIEEELKENIIFMYLAMEFQHIITITT